MISDDELKQFAAHLALVCGKPAEPRYVQGVLTSVEFNSVKCVLGTDTICVDFNIVRTVDNDTGNECIRLQIVQIYELMKFAYEVVPAIAGQKSKLVSKPICMSRPWSTERLFIMVLEEAEILLRRVMVRVTRRDYEKKRRTQVELGFNNIVGELVNKYPQIGVQKATEIVDISFKFGKTKAERTELISSIVSLL